MTELTPIAITYAPLLRYLAAMDGGVVHHDEDVAVVARAIGKVPSNLRRDLPRLREAHLIDPVLLAISGTGRAVLAQIDGAAVTQTAAGANPGLTHAQIAPDPLNPRKTFDDASIAELAASIAEHGLIQALTVRRPDAAGAHLIIAGERRWRAIGVLIEGGRWPADRPVPAQVRDVADDQAALMAIIENVQRKDLSPLEEAGAYARLQSDFQLTTAQIAERVGFTQRHVQSRLSFLKLDESDKAFLQEGRISIEEARRRAQSTEEKLSTASGWGLTDPELYLLAEIADAIESRGVGAYDKQVECAHDAKGPELHRLTKLNIIKVEIDEARTHRNYIKRSWEWNNAVRLGPPAIDHRGAPYRAEFLNEPKGGFPLSAAAIKAKEDRKAETARTRQANKKERAAAEARNAKLKALEDVAQPFWAWQIRKLAAEAHCPLPWSIDGKYGGLLDADGKRIGNFSAGRWDSKADPMTMNAIFELALKAITASAHVHKLTLAHEEPDEPATADLFADQNRRSALEEAAE